MAPSAENGWLAAGTAPGRPAASSKTGTREMRIVPSGHWNRGRLSDDRQLPTGIAMVTSLLPLSPFAGLAPCGSAQLSSSCSTAKSVAAARLETPIFT